ncbi:hypothetical protein [Microbulbifer taiwanensis]|uniref:Uncharacterized protein n=1 Tax=Microbulbifer taiwanensis TaxID=986746 RepID=A0ABW1YJ65_9GAMM
MLGDRRGQARFRLLVDLLRVVDTAVQGLKSGLQHTHQGAGLRLGLLHRIRRRLLRLRRLGGPLLALRLLFRRRRDDCLQVGDILIAAAGYFFDICL